MAVGEEKVHGNLNGALADLKQKFKGGLNALYYKDVPYLPLYIASGSLVKFGLLRPDGQVHLIVYFNFLSV
jgi:hypothetical protein